MGVRTTHTERLRVPGQRQSSQGESGPKPRTLSRRRWKAGRKVLHQHASLRVKRGRDREREPIEWTGSVASRKRETQANPCLVERDRWHEPPHRGRKSCAPRSPRKAASQTCLLPVPHTDTGRQGDFPQGGRANLCQGTRQIDPVPSEEGVPW
jgi:hypothetical protein